MVLSAPVPEDIITDIVEYISSDKETLLACSLVSRSFLAPTRRILFASITIPYFHPPTRCHGLSDILFANPGLLFIHQEIDIQGRNCVMGHTHSWWQPSPRHVADLTTEGMVLPGILNKLSRPTTLRILSLSFISSSLDQRWNALTADLEKAVERMLGFPNLNRVSLGGTSWTTEWHFPPSDQCRNTAP